MALYSFANGQIIPALRLLYRARYLAVLIYGDDHPDMAQLDVSGYFVKLSSTSNGYHFQSHISSVSNRYPNQNLQFVFIDSVKLIQSK